MPRTNEIDQYILLKISRTTTKSSSNLLKLTAKYFVQDHFIQISYNFHVQ
jgi:hypothetical protein